MHDVQQAKQFGVNVVYNGVDKPLSVQPEESTVALLNTAIDEFHIAQNRHLLSLYRQNGELVPESGSVESVGIVANQILLLRPNQVKGGAV